MKNRWFWKSWPSTYWRHWLALSSVFISCLFFMWYYHIKGTDSVIQWERFQEKETIETTLHEFQSGPFHLSVPADVQILFEYFQGGRLTPNVFISYIFVFVLAFAFVYCITIFSALERFWYFASMALVILFLAGMRLDVLFVFGIQDQWFVIGVMALYIGTSFYFNAFKSSTPFWIRFVVFSLFTLILALIIQFYAEVELPFLYLSVTGYIPAIILTVLFSIMVAHEIPAGFLFLTTQSQSAKGLRHFLIVMLIYLINIALIYAHEARLIHWNILYIDIYLLFTTTTIVGIWGWKHREVLYEKVMPFFPFGAYFYVVMASIAFMTIAFLKGTGNDAPIKALSDIIVFTHLGFGIVFVLYVFSNFLGVIGNDLSAWKVVYKPNRMPYETFRLGGIIIVLGLVFYNNWREYVYDSFAGFWNSMGDLYVELDKNDIAQLYYEQGRTYGYANHHSNYAKAYQYAGDFQWKLSHEYYDRAKVRRPTAFVFANDANVYNWEKNTFGAIESLRSAMLRMPDVPQLQNNLGFLYGKVHALDSSLYWLREARSNTETRALAETNFVGVAAQELLPIPPDSLAALFDINNPGVAANALALAAITHTNFKSDAHPFNNTKLNLHTASLLNNFLINKVYTITDEQLELAEKIARDSVNAGFSEMLRASIAHAYYLQGNVSRGIQLMNELSYISDANKGKFNYCIGLWLLEQQNPEGAIIAFSYAHHYNFKNATLYLAMAETENLNIPEATVLWDTLSLYGNTDEKRLANSFKPVLSMSFQQAMQAKDPIKYQFCRYRLSSKDTVLFNVLSASMLDVNYKAQSLMEMAIRQFEADRISQANTLLEQASTLSVSDAQLKQQLLFSRLQVKAALGELDELAALVKDIEFPIERKLDKIYYEALLNEAGGDQEKAAKAFRYLEVANPFYEEGIIASAQYAKLHSKEPMKAYTILAEAIQLNKSSVRLWKAYLGEALSMGFDDYAKNAREELRRLSVR